MLFDLRKCFFLDRRHYHVDALAPRRFQNQKGKLPVSGDEAVSI